MTDGIGKGFITKNHSRLMNFAFAAKIFAWIALISEALYAGARFIQLQSSYTMQMMYMAFDPPNYLEMLSQNPISAFGLVVDLASILIRGVIFWLVLKGISVGLYMIVETDLNYMDKAEGMIHE